ncbi:hypothetical protein [Sphingomonas bacterium]|uniref:hypothetical protein n=1 Tax=Sphingomonas bacterium TaxID=1895847 RepID=UPI001575455E|nr:hypothetical protein [Sphingomonas bacterium]
MDDDAELIARLCARAGMMMEDVSVLAITMPREAAVRRDTVAKLAASADAIRLLVQAALALDQHDRT